MLVLHNAQSKVQAGAAALAAAELKAKTAAGDLDAVQRALSAALATGPEDEGANAAVCLGEAWAKEEERLSEACASAEAGLAAASAAARAALTAKRAADRAFQRARKKEVGLAEKAQGAPAELADATCALEESAGRLAEKRVAHKEASTALEVGARKELDTAQARLFAAQSAHDEATARLAAAAAEQRRCDGEAAKLDKWARQMKDRDAKLRGMAVGLRGVSPAGEADDESGAVFMSDEVSGEEFEGRTQKGERKKELTVKKHPRRKVRNKGRECADAAQESDDFESSGSESSPAEKSDDGDELMDEAEDESSDPRDEDKGVATHLLHVGKGGNAQTGEAIDEPGSKSVDENDEQESTPVKEAPASPAPPQRLGKRRAVVESSSDGDSEDERPLNLAINLARPALTKKKQAVPRGGKMATYAGRRGKQRPAAEKHGGTARSGQDTLAPGRKACRQAKDSLRAPKSQRAAPSSSSASSASAANKETPLPSLGCDVAAFEEQLGVARQALRLRQAKLQRAEDKVDVQVHRGRELDESAKRLALDRF